MTISLSCDMMKDITEERHRENTMVKKFTTTQTIFTGWGALQENSAALSGLGKKPLVVTSAGTWKRMGAQLAEQLSGCFSAYAVCDCINSEPTDVMIAEGLATYQKNGCDCLIGIGGGSPLDAMKAIAVGTTSSAPLASYMGKEIGGALPSMAAIPTTAGTGSEVTKFTIITDTKTDVKMLLKGEVLLPQLAIVDASLSESTPQSVTAATGLDALTHAIEAYTSKQAQPLTDALAVSAVKRIFSYLPAAYRDGKKFQSTPSTRRETAKLHRKAFFISPILVQSCKKGCKRLHSAPEKMIFFEKREKNSVRNLQHLSVRL